jgi:glycosyltransferase involved in cell wall biosynthesis
MPGCRDVVRHGWNGLLVPPRDVTALADAILKLLASADVRSLMGCRSRAYVKEQFDLQCVANAYAAIYHRLLGTSSARSQPED